MPSLDGAEEGTGSAVSVPEPAVVTAIAWRAKAVMLLSIANLPWLAVNERGAEV